ncbi:RNA polymerase sigma factor [Streptomyces sp. NPDC017988]|uniref:RNA polymerase sigma factor n=1 Tax=Streptomyces sp. NPDC017988 TaxID=3365025 RepID=UPI0037891AC9
MAPYHKAHNNPIALSRTMLTAARNDFYRQQARRVPEASFTDLAYTEPVTADDLLALRGYDSPEQALNRLQARAPQQAECVRLRYTEDLTTAEVAARLNISEGAVRTNHDYNQAGARTFACLLYCIDRTESALFWWGFAAGVGDPLAAHLLAVYHALDDTHTQVPARAPARARAWRAFARLLHHHPDHHLPRPVQGEPRIAEGLARPVPWKAENPRLHDARPR